MIALILIFFLGVMTPIQTAANSRLRLSVVTPLVASLVSFAIGSLFLSVATLFEKGSLAIPHEAITGLPWWGWLGGMCGLYGLTVNIIIFPKLGSVQTALMPMLGQICMGMLIDTFGWLNAPVHQLTYMRIIALCLILGGIVMVIHKKEHVGKKKQGGLLLWQIIGFSGGAIFAMQPPMNSLLSGALSSSIHSALITFYTASILLLAVVLITPDNRSHIISIFSLNRPWWSWLGGIIGGTFVTGFAFFAAKVGVGVLLVTSICGMLAMSLAIDKFGILGATKKQIGILQYGGLLLVIAGIVLLRLF